MSTGPRSLVAMLVVAAVPFLAWIAPQTKETSGKSAVVECDKEGLCDLTPQKLVGSYLATDVNWRIGYLTLRNDGQFFDEHNKLRGTWSLAGQELTLNWSGYEPAKLHPHHRGRIWCDAKDEFVMVRDLAGD
jgi:hypothetical protein